MPIQRNAQIGCCFQTDLWYREILSVCRFLSDDISSADFKTLNGKRIGVLIGAKPEAMLNEWELKNGLKTIHINIKSKEEALAKLENGEIDCFISLEEPSWLIKMSRLLHELANQIFILQLIRIIQR